MHRSRPLLLVVLTVVAMALPQLTPTVSAEPSGADVVEYDSFIEPLAGGGSNSALRLGSEAAPATRAVRVGRAGPTTVAAESRIAAQQAAKGVTYTVDSRTLPKSAGADLAAAAITYDYIGKWDCLSNATRGGAAGSVDGWVKNHFAWCQAGRVTVRKLVNKKLVAYVSMRHVFEARFTRTSRTATFYEYFDEIATVGQWAGGVTVGLFMDCWGTPTPGQCRASSGRQVWVRTGMSFTQRYTAGNSKSGTAKPDYKGYSIAQPYINAYDATGGGTVVVPDVAYRCDSASYTKPGNACILHRISGTLTYDRKDAAVAAVARHIYAAQKAPESTHPKWKGKTVPSRIHRLYHDTKRRAKNHATAVKTCKKVWGKYDTKKYQCDEYPFQSSREGAAKGDRRYSARVLNKKQNMTAGSRLGTWYLVDHIIDGDALNIAIR